MKRICVFCGSSCGSRPEYRAAAEELGAEMVRQNTASSTHEER
jgi:predicted Rossmann-fold nucleotide-binding protein